MSPELTPEQAKAYFEALKRLEELVEDAVSPWRGATLGLRQDDLARFKKKYPYSDEELARALYGEDYL